jgi:hypothetical protein
MLGKVGDFPALPSAHVIACATDAVRTAGEDDCFDAANDRSVALDHRLNGIGDLVIVIVIEHHKKRFAPGIEQARGLRSAARVIEARLATFGGFDIEEADHASIEDILAIAFLREKNPEDIHALAGGRADRCGGRADGGESAVFVIIILDGLSEIRGDIERLHGFCLAQSRLHAGETESGENHDDGNDDEQFHESEAATERVKVFFHIV